MFVSPKNELKFKPGIPPIADVVFPSELCCIVPPQIPPMESKMDDPWNPDVVVDVGMAELKVMTLLPILEVMLSSTKPESPVMDEAALGTGDSTFIEDRVLVGPTLTSNDDMGSSKVDDEV